MTLTRAILFCSRRYNILSLKNSKLNSSHRIEASREELIPSKVKLYLDLIRLKRPFGVLFVLTPGMFSLALAAPPGSFPDPWLMLKFTVGAFLTRCSGCVINDALDRSFDAHVLRTANRPMAKNLISMKEAIILTTIMMMLAFCILLSFRSKICLLQGILCVPMMILYPLFKRFTYFTSVMLGITTSVGAFMGWSATNFDIAPSITIPLFLGCVAWAVFYDSIYGAQDMKYDQKINVKSVAIFLTKHKIEKLFLGGVVASCVVFWLISGYNSDQTWPYYLSLAGISAYFTWVIQRLDLYNTKTLPKIFISKKFTTRHLMCAYDDFVPSL
ncbi:4-hydroxybenzoate polyprenyltransferase, mitochondrial [Thelohanellus kitauei]|uniref:4-hydroxybenzoate polyprenyltransferase, mitochondrial n=1 Tax=Thelohanellus kitauei TaxID=669202 RepID=A0A0C2I8J8_THEKT|nr:4-hydroxybenzoate polyprenyltransferase, mitochondrial [Thelohanellus kitauei]